MSERERRDRKKERAVIVRREHPCFAGRRCRQRESTSARALFHGTVRVYSRETVTTRRSLHPHRRLIAVTDARRIVCFSAATPESLTGRRMLQSRDIVSFASGHFPLRTPPPPPPLPAVSTTRTMSLFLCRPYTTHCSMYTSWPVVVVPGQLLWLRRNPRDSSPAAVADSVHPINMYILIYR